MKSTKTMTYKELENELFKNRCELRTASLERKRELISRNHDLMVEMDSRWNSKKNYGGHDHDREAAEASQKPAPAG